MLEIVIKSFIPMNNNVSLNYRLVGVTWIYSSKIELVVALLNNGGSGENTPLWDECALDGREEGGKCAGFYTVGYHCRVKLFFRSTTGGGGVSGNLT